MRSWLSSLSLIYSAQSRNPIQILVNKKSHTVVLAEVACAGAAFRADERVQVAIF
jgi:hypothetical protein